MYGPAFEEVVRVGFLEKDNRGAANSLIWTRKGRCYISHIKLCIKRKIQNQTRKKI
jgi:hypothetical protein